MSLEMSPSPSVLASAPPLINRLRPYQREVALAVLDSVFNRKGYTFSVEIAWQGGKNELLLLTLYMAEPQNLVKCSPTFKLQAVVSMIPLNPMESMRIIDDPDWIRVIVAGKTGSYMGIYGSQYHESMDWVTKKVTLLADWDKLVQKYKDVVPVYARY